jgi:hypothetical protein
MGTPVSMGACQATGSVLRLYKIGFCRIRRANHRVPLRHAARLVPEIDGVTKHVTAIRGAANCVIAGRVPIGAIYYPR